MSQRDPAPAPGPPSAPSDAGISAPLWSSPPTSALEPATTLALAVPEHERYAARELLGVGGMGRVVSTWDRRLERAVALKSPNPEVPLDADLDARLAVEARITARLDHPGIVPIFDAGTGPDGRVYYTMPIVRGRSLAAVLQATTDTEARLRLLRRVLEACEAVGFAHHQGIIHCDLKPTNVMLGSGGGTRVVDWGLARVVGEHAAGGVGTPQYMSPEQALGAPADTRTDVWSLGAILYEVCLGRPLRSPSSASELRERARAEVASESVVETPATLAPELVAIVTRALRPRPADRYPDAGALADDLARFLDGRRVTAHAYSGRELLVRFLRAWRVPLLVAAAALVVVAVLVTVGMVELRAEARRAEQAEAATRAALERASDDLARAILTQAVMASQEGARPEAEILAAHALVHAESPLARGILAAWSAEPAPRLVTRLELPRCLGVHTDGATLACREAGAVSAWDISGVDRPARPARSGRPALRWRVERDVTDAVVFGDDIAVRTSYRALALLDGATGALLESQETASADRLRVVSPSPRGVDASSRSRRPRGELVATDNGSFWIWQPLPSAEHPVVGPPLRPPTENATYPCNDRGMMGSVAFTPDGDWTAACYDGTFIVGHFGAARPRPPPRAVDTGLALARVPLAMAYLDASHVVAGTSDGDLVIIDLATGESRATITTGLAKVTSVVVSPDGRWIAVSAASGAVVLVDAVARAVHGRLPAVATGRVSFDRGDLIIAGRELRRYELPVGLPARIPIGEGVTSVAFDPSGAQLAITTGQRVVVRDTIRAGLVAEHVPASDMARSGRFIKGGSFSHDGRHYRVHLVRDGTHFAWTTHDWSPVAPLAVTEHSRRMVQLADGSMLSAWYRGGVVRYRAGQTTAEPILLGTRVADLSVSSDGLHAAVLFESGGELRHFDLTADTTRAVTIDRLAHAVAIGKGGALVATAGLGGVNLWHTADGSAVGRLDAAEARLIEVAISPLTRWIAAGAQDGSVWIWELASQRLAARLDAHAERVASLAFTPSEALLATGSWDGTVRIFGLDVLDRPAAALVHALEAQWGFRLADVHAR